MLPIFKIAYPKLKEGINLKIHYTANPASTVEGIILKTNTTKGKIAPLIKCTKNDAT